MILAIDFETYFDSECTLKKLNYIQYLNHPKFEVIGAAILHGNRHEFLTHDELVDFLDDLDPAETSVLAHNTLFDGCILAWRYNFHPRKWLDTLSMAKGKLASPSHSLDAVAQHFGLPRKKSATFKGKTWNELTREEQRNLEDYARHDVWLCREIYDRLMPYPQSELDLIDLTVRMFVEPTLELDLALADELLLEQRANKKTLREATGLTSTQLSSNKQLAELIKERYNLDPPTKISPTTGEETWALSKTDPEFETFYAGAPPGLQSLLDARIAIKSTIEETRLETLIETQKFVGKIPVPLIYYGGHTGRWSGCLIASTRILVYNTREGLIEKCINQVTLDDLIWDGESFVEHDGLQFSGFREVIEHDGLTGTPDHLVFVDGHSEAISLQTAMQTGCNLQTARSPDQNALDLARATLASRNQEQN